MVTVTLISESQAKVGNRFYFMGSQPECEDCKLKTVCLNLESGNLYRIKGVRNQTHNCSLSEDKARIVEVEIMPFDSVAIKRSAVEGSVITFKEPECKEFGCKNYCRCHPTGISSGRKYSIVSIEGDAECPVGHKLVLTKFI